MGSSPAQPASTGKESKPACPRAPHASGVPGLPWGRGTHPRPVLDEGAFQSLALGWGCPKAPASTRAGFGRLGGLAGGGGWLPVCQLLEASTGCLPGGGGRQAGPDRGTATQPHGWREDDSQAVALVATGGTWDGGMCASARCLCRWQQPQVVSAPPHFPGWLHQLFLQPGCLCENKRINNGNCD